MTFFHKFAYRKYVRSSLKMDYQVSLPEAEKDERLYDVIRSAVCAVLADEGFHRPAYVSVEICGPDRIRDLNRQFREKDAETDVLSFPLWDADERPGKGLLELGDIVISLPRCRQQAEELGHSVYREAAFLAAHSTLHLLGYDHERSEKDDEDMCDRQRRAVAFLKIT